MHQEQGPQTTDILFSGKFEELSPSFLLTCTTSVVSVVLWEFTTAQPHLIQIMVLGFLFCFYLYCTFHCCFSYFNPYRVLHMHQNIFISQFIALWACDGYT